MSAAEECALQVMETLPLVMRRARLDARRHRSMDLSPPQFHSLRMLECHGAISLNDLAHRLDMTAPTASRLVQTLSEQGLVTRQVDQIDRRRLVLQLTAKGRDTLEVWRKDMIAALAQRLAHIPDERIAALIDSLHLLREVFSEQAGAGGESP
jgi:DNA-binding MarR family transcriptional regulator